jgi:hypothetical protein
MGRDFFVPPGARAAVTAATTRAGAALYAAKEFTIAAPNPPYLSSSLQMPSDMVRGCERGCVEELCWLFFVPCEQSAPMCVLLRTPEQ